MPLIEGIGDEVTVVMSVLILLITMAVSWVSTRVSIRPPTSLTFTRNEYLDQDLIQEDELPEEVYNTNITQNEFENIVADTNQDVDNVGPDENNSSANASEADGMYESSPDNAQSTNLASCYNTGENIEGNNIEINLQNKDSSSENPGKNDNTDEFKNETGDSKALDTVDVASNISSQNTEGQSSSQQTGSDSQEHNMPTNAIVEVIRIRLKFLNESERTVDVNSNITLFEFKRDAFVEETSQGFTLRLILNGHILQDEQRTLAQLNINNNCVIHCQLLEARTIANTVPNVNHSELDIGQVMIPMFAVLLGLVWYVRLEYRHLFTATSTLSLFGVSILFFLAVLASWRS